MFYVTVINGPRVSRLVGPFETHEEALEWVEPARRKAQEWDSFAWFYSYGTARYAPENSGFRGVLNDAVGAPC